jgi:hypothetical protein
MYWTWLRFLLVIGGMVAGFVVATMLSSALIPDNGTMEFLAGIVVGPIVGGSLGWRIWVALWASGGRAG